MENDVVTKNDTFKSGALAITLFKNPTNAQEAFRDLLNRGYKKDDIIIMMSKETERQHFLPQSVSTTELGNKSLSGTGVGGTIGGTVGAITAGIAAMGTTLFIPGLGIVVAGSIAAALAGGGAGAAVGGLVGALIGLGMSDDLAKEFETGIKNGGIVVGVYTKTTNDYEILNRQWKAFQSVDFRPQLGL